MDIEEQMHKLVRTGRQPRVCKLASSVKVDEGKKVKLVGQLEDADYDSDGDPRKVASIMVIPPDDDEDDFCGGTTVSNGLTQSV